MKTHRCQGSLEAKMSIRYGGGSSWWLYKPVHDFDWDTYYLNGITKINFCPFCGKKLGGRNG